MIRGRLSWQLLRIGWAAGRGGPGGRVRFVALLLASALLSVTLMAVIAATAAYDQRAQRDDARGPLFADSGQTATALWRLKFDRVGDVQHAVLFVEPLRASAPPPPGLRRWPAPGEEFVSPGLAHAGAIEHITTRYGRFGGFISASGLTSPGERLAYVRPLRRDAQADDWFPITGFGRNDGFARAVADVRPLWSFLLFLICLVGVPAAAATVVAVRCGSAMRDRRDALLRALGGGRLHRSLVDLGEAALPVLVGSALGALPMLAVMPGDVRMPLTGYVIGADAVREWAWAVPLGALLPAALVFGAVVALHRVDRTGTSLRPRSSAAKMPRWRLVVFWAAFVIEAVSGYLPADLGVYPYVLGMLGVWAMLPSVAAVLSSRFGRRIAEMGRRTGRPAPLVAGRWITVRPGAIVRLSIALIVGLGLITQAQVWYSRLDDAERGARQTDQRIGSSVLLVRPSDPLADVQVNTFARALPVGYHALRLESPHQGSAVLSGPCSTLRSLRIECAAVPSPMRLGTGDARADELRKWLGGAGEPLKVRAAPFTDAGTAAGRANKADGLVVVADRGVAGQAWQIKQTAYATLPRPMVMRLGEDWLVTAARDARPANWFLLFGITGLLILMLVAAVSVSAEFLRVGPALAPLVVHMGRRRLFAYIAMWNLGVPLALAAVVCAVVTAWQGLHFSAVIHGGRFSWTLLAGTMMAGIVLAGLIGLFGGLNVARAARRWRPASD